jgi:uncharacterized protein (TIGR02217 family)
MADIGVLPKLAGQGWSVKKTPTWQTRIQRAVSGRELRALDYPFPLWLFELIYEALGDNLGGAGAAAIGSLLATDLRTLLGFFLACQGAFATFLYDDPTDDAVVGQQIGTGDGATTVFQLARTFGPTGGIGFLEPITAPNFSLPINVYLNGIRQPQAGNWSVNATGALTFLAAAPPARAAVTADFNYYFRCRFLSDAYSFENFMFKLWSLKKLDFISVLP